jgi:transposase-like protein
MARRFSPEFKRDVADVARNSGLTQEQVASDFGVSVQSVQRWVRQAKIDDGLADGATSGEQDELSRLKRRNRVLEQEVEILRRATAYFAKDAAPK